MVRLTRYGLVLTSLLTLGPIVAPTADKVSHITILVQDALGTRINSATIEFRELGTGKDYSGDFDGHEAEVPYGYYTCECLKEDSA